MAPSQNETDMKRRRMLGVVVALAITSVLGLPREALAAPVPAPGESTTASSVAGAFYPVAATRLLGTPTSGYAVQPGVPVTVPVEAQKGVPATGVSAAVVNVVVAAGPSAVTLSARPAVGDESPRPSSGFLPAVVVPAGDTRSALLTVPISATGAFDVSVAGGAASVTADLEGFYAADDTVIATAGISGGYQPVDVTRVYDTRADTPVPPGGTTQLSASLGAGVDPHVTSLLVQVTAFDAAATGGLAVTGTSGGPTAVSYAPGRATSNLAVVPADLDSDGRLRLALTNSGAASVGAAVDVVGFYDDGTIGANLRLRTTEPTRVVDTPTGIPASALSPGVSVGVHPPATVVGASTFAVAGMLTTAPAATETTLELGRAEGAGQPLPVAAGVSTSVPVQAEVASDGTLALRAASGGPAVQGSLDVVATFESSPPVADGAPRSWVSPVSSWQIEAVRR